MEKAYGPIVKLIEKLKSEFTADQLSFVGPSSGEIDAIGWKLNHKPELLFSISSYGGVLDESNLELQVFDYSEDNMGIVVLDNFDIQGIIDEVKKIL